MPSDVVLFGVGPLPLQPGAVASGPSIRTWQFAKPILDSGHRLSVFALRPGREESGEVEEIPLPNGGTLFDCPLDSFRNLGFLRDRLASLKPAAIVGAGSVMPVWTACQLSEIAPFWADIFGDPICELQVKAEMYPGTQNDADYYHVWKMLQDIMRRADIFSALSDPQNHALVGMLGCIGRLHQHTAGYQFVYSIPCGLDPDASIDDQPVEDTLRGKETEEDDFIIAWSGSYNTWMDPDTLFKGLLQAMDKSPRVRFLSTGGGTPIYNEAIYDSFYRDALESRHADRFIFKGWLPQKEAEILQRQCDCGINIDRWSHEAVTGSRSRILHFLNNGIPVMSTVITELSHALSAAGGLIDFEMGRPESLAGRILEMEGNRRLLTSSMKRGREFVRQEYNFGKSAGPCLAWLHQPRRAPDFEISRNGYTNEVLRRSGPGSVEPRANQDLSVKASFHKVIRRLTGR